MSAMPKNMTEGEVGSLKKKQGAIIKRSEHRSQTVISGS